MLCGRVQRRLRDVHGSLILYGPTRTYGIFSCPNRCERVAWARMDVRLEPSWKTLLAEELDKPYFLMLTTQVKQAYLTKTIYPPPAQIFRALDLCPVERVRAVILGQDPYHGKGQAHGLSFSVPSGVRPPPSLQNIRKELQSDLGIVPTTSGDLEAWERQGVLLLNATLTVEADRAGSHQGLGWEIFTNAMIEKLSQQKECLVFILWGRFAQQKAGLIDTSKHLILKAAHPSPFSAYNGFFGSKPFSQTNAYLQANGFEPIDWRV